jgi:hypothetical protein
MPRLVFRRRARYIASADGVHPTALATADARYNIRPFTVIQHHTASWAIHNIIE